MVYLCSYLHIIFIFLQGKGREAKAVSVPRPSSQGVEVNPVWHDFVILDTITAQLQSGSKECPVCVQSVFNKYDVRELIETAIENSIFLYPLLRSSKCFAFLFLKNN